jgi:cytochrome c2
MLLAACASKPVDPLTIGDPERGRDLYETGAGILSTQCIKCHTLEAGGSEQYGPSLVGIGERAGDRVRGMDTVEYLRESIVDPSAYVVDGFGDRMEKFYSALLSEEDIDNLVAFMLTQ